jgi:hypothetical protein
MKALKVSLLLLIAVLFASCSSYQEVLSTWVNKAAFKDHNYKKVFVMALNESKNARYTMETDLSKSFEKLGLQVVTAEEAFPASFTGNAAKPTKAEILAKAKELNCDLIFTETLLKKETESRYVPGTYWDAGFYEPYPAFPYYEGFGLYYDYWTPVVYTPGYFETDRMYFIEGNLFDVASDKILWSLQSETFDPTSLNEFSSSYSNLVAHQAIKDGLFKKM